MLALRIMCLSLFFATLESIPSALLERRLAFRRRAVPDVGSTLFYAVLTFLLLMAGTGFWTHRCARRIQLRRTIAFWLVAPVLPDLPPHPRVSILKPMLGYGILLDAAGLISFLTQNVDTCQSPTSPTARHRRLRARVHRGELRAELPGFFLLRVAFPLLVSAGTVEGRLQGAFASILHATAVLIFPVTAGIAVMRHLCRERLRRGVAQRRAVAQDSRVLRARSEPLSKS